MNVIHQIKMDLQVPEIVPAVHAVQMDSNTRVIKATLYSAGVPYAIGDGSEVSLACIKPDRTKCWYDTLPDGEKAAKIEGNTVSITLIPETLKVSGAVKATIVIRNALSDQISSFPFLICVAPNPAAGETVSNSFYRISSLEELNEAWNDILEKLNSGLDTGGHPIDGVGRLGLTYYGSTEGVMVYAKETVFDENNQALYGVMKLEESTADRSVVVRGVAEGIEDGDAVNVKQLKSFINPAADEKYFDITEYGMASLKPAYRGIGRNASQYSHSDNGVGNVGSQYEELPEVLTIPDSVNGIPVTSLAPGMFAQHNRIKIITIPETIDEIPDYFAFRSMSIEEVKGCSGVSRLGDRAFYASNIRKILMPNLLEIKGQNNFQFCYFLQIIDIGNVKKIPENCFKSCERLLRVNGGSGVTEVGAQAFLCATRLKSVPFAANLTSIGDYGFYRCRVNYPWENHPNKTGFGANSTYAAYNPVDFWAGKTYTAHETPLRATFNQGDPRWENETANADPWYYWAGDCCINSEAVAYSIITQDDAVTPLTYLDEVKKVIDTPPNISDQSSWPLYTVQERLTALGYAVSDALFFNNDLQTLYDALASGKLAIAECCNGDVAAEANDYSYHAVLLHGINEDGEVMAHDSAGWSYIVGAYEPITFSMPIQALTKADYRFYIIEKEE